MTMFGLCWPESFPSLDFIATHSRETARNRIVVCLFVFSLEHQPPEWWWTFLALSCGWWEPCATHGTICDCSSCTSAPKQASNSIQTGLSQPPPSWCAWCAHWRCCSLWDSFGAAPNAVTTKDRLHLPASQRRHCWSLRGPQFNATEMWPTETLSQGVVISTWGDGCLAWCAAKQRHPSWCLQFLLKMKLLILVVEKLHWGCCSCLVSLRQRQMTLKQRAILPLLPFANLVRQMWFRCCLHPRCPFGISSSGRLLCVIQNWSTTNHDCSVVENQLHILRFISTFEWNCITTF